METLPVGYNLSDFIWSTVGLISVGILCLGLIKYYHVDAEKERADNLFLPKEQKIPSILDQIEAESIYCGAPPTTKMVIVTDLYKAAKRARKDKALSRDIRTELDKAINQFENALS